MKRPILFMLIVFPAILPSCAWFVSRKEADEVSSRVERVSRAFAERSADEKALRENLQKVKTELENIREEREVYMTRQAEFMEEVRVRLDGLQARLRELEGRLAASQGQVDSQLQKQIRDVTEALLARAQEISELEKLSRDTAWVATKLSPEDMRDLVVALARGGQWRLAHGHLAMFIQKYSGHATLAETIALLTAHAFDTNELTRVVQYADLYRRMFPAGAAVDRQTWLLSQTYAKFMDCERAIATLKSFVDAYPKSPDFQPAKELLEHLEKMRHSRQVCAP